MERVAQLSENPQAIRNREQVLILLKQQHSTLCATMFSSAKTQPSSYKQTTTQASGSKPENENLIDITTLVSYWPDKDRCSTEEFELGVESYLSRPEIVAIKDNMEALENVWLEDSILTMETALLDNEPITGYVYALWNRFFPDLIKIGFTFRTPEIRARELSGTGLPEPFKVVDEIKCRNPFSLEREIHKNYAHVRTYGKK